MSNKGARVQIKIRIKKYLGFFPPHYCLYKCICSQSLERVGGMLKKTWRTLVSEVVTEGQGIYSNSVDFYGHFYVSTS